MRFISYNIEFLLSVTDNFNDIFPYGNKEYNNMVFYSQMHRCISVFVPKDSTVVQFLHGIQAVFNSEWIILNKRVFLSLKLICQIMQNQLKDKSIILLPILISTKWNCSMLTNFLTIFIFKIHKYLPYIAHFIIF